MYKQIRKLNLKFHLKNITTKIQAKGKTFIKTLFYVNIISEKEDLLLFLSFLYSVNNSEIMNNAKLFTE